MVLGRASVDIPALVHRYGPGHEYIWTVFGPDTNVPGESVYSFCMGNAEHVRVTVIATVAGCGTFPAAVAVPARPSSRLTTGKTPATTTGG